MRLALQEDPSVFLLGDDIGIARSEEVHGHAGLSEELGTSG
jgi:hypothetical protein